MEAGSRQQTKTSQATAKKILPVLNMSCASCASSVQRILEHTPGVVHAAVNYANATAQVEYETVTTNPQKLKAAVQAVGYDLVVEEAQKANDAVEESQRAKYEQLRRRAIGAIVLSIPLAIIGMFFMSLPYADYIMWALATPVVMVFGRQFFIGAWKQAKHRSMNMDTLVALSTGVAYLFSVFNTVYPEYWHARGLHAHVYFEASAVVVAFVLLGKMLEERAKGNTSSAIKKLMGLQPKTVTVVDAGGQQVEVPVAEVMVGQMLLVKPGERIAVDGTVSSGTSYVDESSINGEAIPVDKKTGDKVLAGTINQQGSFQFVADKVGGNTVLAQIIKMVQEAQSSRAPVQRLVDKIAAIFVPVVIAVAILSMALWVLLGGPNGTTYGLLALVTVLVIACPCALGLATPTAIMAGIGKGAENGILIKDAESLELSKKITAVVLDKTGTITEGKPKVVAVAWKDGKEDDGIADIIRNMERRSEHPLARAIVQHFGNAVTHLQPERYESLTGLGIKAAYNGTEYLLGNEQLLTTAHIKIGKELQGAAELWSQQAATVVWFANNEHALAVMAIADKIKPTSATAIKQLHDAGITVHLLTGDNEHTAKSIAQQAGITNYKWGVQPADKAHYVKALQTRGEVVAMVGDGINDSSALAQADVSIAMGRGSDIALDVAKMTIVSSDLMKIPVAIELSKRTVAVIRQNLFWAFVYNVIGIPIAAGALYPINGFLLNPMIAGAAMALSSVSVVTNSLRLRRIKL